MKNMKQYRILGVTELAHRRLEDDDIESLLDMVGMTCYKCDHVSEIDGKSLFMMPDGEETHIDFIQIELIEPELF